MIFASAEESFGPVSGGNYIVKIILIVLLVVVLRAFMVQSKITRGLLLAKRLSAFGLFLILAGLIIFPEVSNRTAHILGVGRGADLLFYLSHLFLLLLIVSLWRRITILSANVTELSRKIAISEAKKPEKK